MPTIQGSPVKRLRRLIPLALRQDIKHSLRQLHDGLKGISFDGSVGALGSCPLISLVQPIPPSTFFENKIINLTRGAALLDGNIIGVRQNWSFWHRIRHPKAANGFVEGRNLVNGKLVALSGGGLCQLASITYHLALLGGLTILERHAHSLDLYLDHQRFTPLGADATVVWGFKDLRLHNPHPVPISLRFRVVENRLIAELLADGQWPAQHVDFVQIPLDAPYIQVSTMVNHQVHDVTIYEQRHGMQVAG
ncbi:VanW family protein [Synechococcus sp. CCY 9618]|uniref:VanW family protein n=1 Tax=Synechococcus sp. CCY 9618 TaxID=2815602 RepID=UPI001C236C21|nr:VanW family protein [Synechococcus sp. CCY 9618]